MQKMEEMGKQLEKDDNWRKEEFTELIEGLKQNGMPKIKRGIRGLRYQR